MPSIVNTDQILVGVQDIDSLLALDFLASAATGTTMFAKRLHGGRLSKTESAKILEKFNPRSFSVQVAGKPASLVILVGISDKCLESDLESLGFRIHTILRPASGTLLAAVQSFCAAGGDETERIQSDVTEAIVDEPNNAAAVALFASAALHSAASLYLMFQDILPRGEKLLDRCFSARRAANNVGTIISGEMATTSTDSLKWGKAEQFLASMKTALAAISSEKNVLSPLNGDNDVASIARFSCGREQNVLTVGAELTLIHANKCLRDKVTDRLLQPRFDELDEKRKGDPHAIDRLVAETENALCLFYHVVPASGIKFAPLSALELNGSVCSSLFQASSLKDLSAKFPGLVLASESKSRLSAKARPGVLKEQATIELDRLADIILNLVLLGNRPVARWRTHFFAGYAVKDSADTDNLVKQFAEQQNSQPEELLKTPNAVSSEKDYFLPELRERLYGNNSPTATGQGIYSRTLGSDLFGLKLRICHGNYSAMELGLYEVKLHVQGNGTVVIEWVSGCEVEKANLEAHKRELTRENEYCNAGTKDWKEPAYDPLKGGSEILWRDLLYRVAENDCVAPSLARIMDFNAEARLIGHSYLRKSVDREQIVRPVKTELLSDDKTVAVAQFAQNHDLPDISAYLLAKMLGKELAEKFKRVTDDRARVLTSVVLEGGMPEKTEKFDILMARLSMVDPYGEGDPYDPAFWRDEFNASRYNRFWSFGSLFMATNHSFSFVGFRHNPGIEDHTDAGSKAANNEGTGKHLPRPSFSEAVIHQEHMKGAYRRVFLHFLFMESNLRAISAGLVKLEDDVGEHRKPLDKKIMARIFDLRHALTLCASNMRQVSLSGQLQGQELTAHLHRQFKLDPEWEALDRKVVALENLIETDATRRSQGIQSVLYYLGIPVALAVFLFGFAPGSVNSLIWVGIENLASSRLLDWIPWSFAVIIALLAGFGASLILTIARVSQTWVDFPDIRSRLKNLLNLRPFRLFVASLLALAALWL